ncbi:MAG: internal scaffolding protein [Microviridae sp.]|nr:MAG: internal scaffolding protein [Microviridae sp.]
MNYPQLKSSYDDHTAASNETGLKCEDPSLAQQHQKDETDINLIVRNYVRTGELPVHHLPPLTDDFAEITDMQTAMNRVVEAREAFMEQPANVRARFHNNPVEFVEFCSDPDNHAEMRKLGLLSPEAETRIAGQELAAREQAERDRIELEALRKANKAPNS